MLTTKVRIDPKLVPIHKVGTNDKMSAIPIQINKFIFNLMYIHLTD